MTLHSWRVESLIRNPEPAALARRAGDRLLTLIAGLHPHDTFELALLGGDGQVRITMTATSPVPGLDELAAWVWEDIGTVVATPPQRQRATPERCAELVPAIRMAQPNMWAEFADEASAPNLVPADLRTDVWPNPYPVGGLELLRALRSTRAEVRLHLAPAADAAAHMVRHELRHSTLARDPELFDRYAGTPVAARLLVGFEGHLSPRLRAALLDRGGGLALRDLDPGSAEAGRAWEGDPVSLLTAALPVGAARCLTPITAPGMVPEICGIPTIEPPAEVVPLADGACDAGLRLGSAMSASGRTRDVRLAPEDLLLHTQVIGSTGTGKSSLLAALVGEARSAGLGVTVIDPHGQLVQRVLEETPEAGAASVVAVRHGDPDRPVPVNPFAGRSPELMADVMISVLRELHDPGNQGFLGPVWERWLSSFMKLQQALIGPMASLALLPDLASEHARLALLVKDMQSLYPVAAREMWGIVARKPDEFAESATWFIAKFQRMVNSPELRGILGSGRDAVDVVEAIDSRQMLLVDLASPVLGDLGAQLLGEMWLAKHWEALSQRAEPNRPHLLVIDEAHLFASGLLPRLLTQARKFGIAVVLAHQNLEQLTLGLREAVLASTNNVVVFRTGLREASAADQRLGSWSGGSLTRLARLTAAATLSTGIGLTDAFTLTVDHNGRAPGPDRAVAARIVERTKATFGLAAPAPLSFSTLRDSLTRRVAAAKASSDRHPIRPDGWAAHRRPQASDLAGTRD